MEIQAYWLYWTAFFAVVLAWSLIVHYAARKVLEQQAWAAPGEVMLPGDPRLAKLIERYRLPAAWVPRILGLLCIYAVWLGITGAAQDLAAARRALDLPDPRRLLWFLVAATAAYVAYVVVRRRLVDPASRSEPLGDYLHDLVTGGGGSLLIEPNPFWFFDLATRTGRQARRRGPSVRWDVIAVVLLLSLAVVWVIAVIWPWLVEIVTPRALFVILMLGLPVSLLAFLSVLSHYLRVPLIAGLILLLSVLTGLVPTFHDLRQVEGRNVTRLGARPSNGLMRWD
ncbi:hypothetical protein [Methylobacterium nodulans]|nr:hypothetical protein [Methylobacterium nodulans]